MAQGIVTISSAALAPPYFSSPQNLTSSQQASFDSMQDICTVTSDSGLLCIGANGNQAIAANSTVAMITGHPELATTLVVFDPPESGELVTTMCKSTSYEDICMEVYFSATGGSDIGAPVASSQVVFDTDKIVDVLALEARAVASSEDAECGSSTSSSTSTVPESSTFTTAAASTSSSASFMGGPTTSGSSTDYVAGAGRRMVV